MDYKDYYKLLGVERGASQDEIKRSYRKLALDLLEEIASLRARLRNQE